LADRFIFGVASIDYGPVLLLMPFGFHLAMDTLPSGDPQVGGFRSALACFRLSLSCPFRPLHTFHLLRPARRYPRVRIWRSSFERQRDFNPPDQRAAQRTLRPSPTPALAVTRTATLNFGGPPATGLPQSPGLPSRHAVPTTPADRRRCLSISFLAARPSPNLSGVGIRDFTFEACSGFTHVTACRVAHQP